MTTPTRLITATELAHRLGWDGPARVTGRLYKARVRCAETRTWDETFIPVPANAPANLAHPAASDPVFDARAAAVRAFIAANRAPEAAGARWDSEQFAEALALPDTAALRRARAATRRGTLTGPRAIPEPDGSRPHPTGGLVRIWDPSREDVQAAVRAYQGIAAAAAKLGDPEWLRGQYRRAPHGAGRSSRDIAGELAALRVAPHTVRKHIAAALAEVGETPRNADEALHAGRRAGQVARARAALDSGVPLPASQRAAFEARVRYPDLTVRALAGRLGIGERSLMTALEGRGVPGVSRGGEGMSAAQEAKAARQLRERRGQARVAGRILAAAGRGSVRLSPMQRRALEGRVEYVDLTVAELAARLGVPQGSLSAALSKAFGAWGRRGSGSGRRSGGAGA